LMILVYDNY